MKVALFFGSFNPIHVGHLIIASHIAEHTDHDQVWFVVSPQNPLKNKKQLLSEYDRLDLVHAAIEGDERLRATDIEFNMPRPSYTIHTLLYLQEKHPDHEFSLIMGSDTVNTLPKWKNYEEIIKNYGIIAYPRPEADIKNDLKEQIKLTEVKAPLMQISSNYIRRNIKNKKSVKYLLPERVNELIDKWGYYQ